MWCYSLRVCGAFNSVSCKIKPVILLALLLNKISSPTFQRFTNQSVEFLLVGKMTADGQGLRSSLFLHYFVDNVRSIKIQRRRHFENA